MSDLHCDEADVIFDAALAILCVNPTERQAEHLVQQIWDALGVAKNAAENEAPY